jgi:uncharacterized phage-like protein YoqJ
MNLADENLLDFHHPLHEVVRAKDLAICHIFDRRFEFVDDELKPKLVRLVDDDEEHLIVMGGLG